MKKLFILLLLVVACKEKNQTATQFQIEAHTQQIDKVVADTILCPNSKEKPHILVKIEENLHLAVCGYKESDIGTIYSEFDVYPLKNKKDWGNSLLFMSALEKADVIVKDSKLQITKLDFFDNDWIPTFLQEISCKASVCEVSPEKCVFQKPERPDFKLSEIKSYQKSKKSTDEMVIYRLAALALSGDREAQKILVEQENTINVDGASAEALASSKKLILKLQDFNCL